MKQQTHLGIDGQWVGQIIEMSQGRARAALEATSAMSADDRGLVHGGFTFGLADFAAMCAVNDPNVVLGAADCRFLAPVRVGQRMFAEAEVEAEKGRRRTVKVKVEVEGVTVLEGTLACFVLDRHVLDG